jgi:outer membrane immunogenic protein
MMRRILTAAALSLAAGSSAWAADVGIPAYKAPIVSPVPAYNWSGLYIGGHIGGAWSEQDFRGLGPSTFFFNPALGSTSHSGSGIIGGGQIGYNFQTGPFVLGVEGTFSGLDVSRTSQSPFYLPPTFNDRFTTDISSLWTVTGRVGYAAGPILAYAKGGFASGRVRNRIEDLTTAPCPACQVVSSTNWRDGYTIGGGVEYGITRNLSLGLEYMFTDLGSNNHSLIRSNSGGAVENYRLDTQAHQFTARANYKFDLWR